MNASPSVRREFALPPPELREFVERLWSWETDTAVPLPLLLPGTGAELVLHHRKPFVALGSDGSRHLPAALVRFGVAAARVRPTTGSSIGSLDDLLAGEVREANAAAQALGVRIGMSGREALEKL